MWSFYPKITGHTNSEGRRQEAEGNSPLLIVRLILDVLYFAASSLSIIIGFNWALDPETLVLIDTSYLLPSALDPLHFFVNTEVDSVGQSN
jgi:hypothetical protein